MAEQGPLSPIHGSPSISSNAEKLRMQRLYAQEKLAQIVIRQKETKSEFTQWTELAAFNPLIMSKRFETLDKRLEREESQEAAETFTIEEGTELDAVQLFANDFVTRRNSELKARTLLIIRSHLHPDDDVDQILEKITKVYADPSLADDVLDFLIESNVKEEELAKNLAKAKIQFNETYLREIVAGKNIAAQAREFSEKGLGSPTALRDIYRDITGNPREPATLFEELSNHFTYDKMKIVLSFILHALGNDLKSKGPSINPSELQRILTETKTMQTILGIYAFFKQRMNLIKNAFARAELTYPDRLTFELLAKQFVKMVQERYPSPDKILKIALLLGLSEEIAAQIIVFTQYRDALRYVSPRIFRSEKQRQDLLMSTIEALSDLEDSLEEEDEEE